MTKVLIVDDDPGKMGFIIRAIDDSGLENVETLRTATAAEAIRAAREQNIDVAVVDIVLPSNAGDPPRPQTGIALVERLAREPNGPKHIVAITEYEAEQAPALAQLSVNLVSVVLFSRTSDAWVRPLVGRIAQVAAQERTPHESDYDSLLAVVCALDMPELSAVLENGWSWKRELRGGDGAVYYRTDLQKNGTANRIVAAAASRVGLAASTALATKITLQFRPKYLAMVGIAAGVPARSSIGDVILADPCWDYGSGKYSVAEHGRMFEPAPYQHSTPVWLRNRIRQELDINRILYEAGTDWPGPKPAALPRLIVGPMASGAAVIADGETLLDVERQHRKLVGIDMEAYGVFVAAEESVEPRPEPFVIKTIVDHGDASKRDHYQAYGSYLSAYVLRELTERLL